jgi:hypothetical protein
LAGARVAALRRTITAPEGMRRTSIRIFRSLDATAYHVVENIAIVEIFPKK